MRSFTGELVLHRIASFDVLSETRKLHESDLGNRSRLAAISTISRRRIDVAFPTKDTVDVDG